MDKPTHLNIVALEGVHFTIPTDFDLPPPFTHSLTVHMRTSPAELHSRVRDAHVLIIAVIKLDSTTLSAATSPNLRLILVTASGVDAVQDLELCRKRGIRVCNCPGANVDAVAEHAIGQYFAARRKTVLMHDATREMPSVWKAKNTLSPRMRDGEGKEPITCREEIMGVIGHGVVGKRIAQLGQALGMEVHIAGRKHSDASTAEGRTPFTELIKRSTVIVLSIPRLPETVNLISTAELRSMSQRAILINVSRGGIVDESALVTALKEGWISGAATDVFATEPADANTSPLLSKDVNNLNLTVSPHLAWFGETTMENYARMLKDNIASWCASRELNVIV